MPGFDKNVGSGVVMESQGVILTNTHVVANADEVLVRLADGNEMPAKSILTDPLGDVAVLRVTPDSPLPTAKLGDSEALEVGEWVIAIGSPFELETTVSAGIISGKGRGIERIKRGRLIQTDAAINPGNSGGPLVNLDGEVVGINTAIATSNGGYQGIGFAIPVNRAKWIARELLDHGAVRRAYLGIKIGELEAEAARKIKLPPRSGVWVEGIVSGGPADEAGMKYGDVIVTFDNRPVKVPGDLQDVVETKAIGSKQTLEIVRQSKKISLTVTVQALPEEPRAERPAPKKE
jgi:serine protease Do